MALVGTTGRRALEYRPEYSESTKGEIVDFDKLASEAEKILTSDYDGEPIITDIMAVAAKVGLNKQRSTEIVEEFGTLVKENKIKI